MGEVEDALEKYQGLVPLVYDIETMGLAEARPQDMYYAVYLKREADKVIRHQKYKRCLAMARWCHTNDQMTSRLYKEACIVKIQGRDSYFFQARWWEKWHKRWLQLAEQVKTQAEAK